MRTCSHSRLGDQLYAPLYPVRIPTPFSFMRTAALVTDILRSPSRLHTCPCNPAVLIPIRSPSAELYFPSSIIISLFPIEHCFEDYLASILLIQRGLRHWDALQTHQFFTHRPTHPLETVCVLLLDLVVSLTKFLLVLIFYLGDTLVRAHLLSQQPSLRTFP